MKKIYVFLLFVFLFGFVAMDKASGQSCDKCLPNSACIPLTFDLPGCDSVKVTLCVRCGVTNPSIYWRGVTYENICPGYENEIKQYVENWIRENTLEICGNRPCQEPPPFQVYFSKPLCGDVFWDGSRYHIYDAGVNCQNYCLDERAWCWCNCVPGECWDDECERRGGTPYFNYFHIRYSETNPGACDFVPYGYHPATPTNLKFEGGAWTEPLRCVRIYWSWSPPSQECND